MNSSDYAAVLQHFERLAAQGYQQQEEEILQFDPQGAIGPLSYMQNLPYSERYDPSAPPPQAVATYNPTGSQTGSNNGGMQVNHAQHHNLLLPLMSNPYAPPGTSTLTTNGTYCQQHTGHQQLPQCGGATFEPIPIAVPPAKAQTPSMGPSTTNQNGIYRSSSFDDLLLLSPSIFAPLDPLNVEFDPTGTANLANCPAAYSLHSGSVVSSGSNSSNFIPSLPTLSRPPSEAWLEDIRLNVPSLSLEPLTGTQIVERLRLKMDDVIKRYIPCTQFLVQCQQDLRKGLAAAQSRKSRRSHSSSPRQYFNTYIDPLPNTFIYKNQFTMDATALSEAARELGVLRNDAKNSESKGCEAMKNAFLGGMKEGKSWGLRQWLSKNGNALTVCTDLECIMQACRSLEKSKATTKQLAALLRPIARDTLDRLKNDIPATYQERSTAHPYLPFFHRLEAALRGVATFDPEEDDVICLDSDDDDDDEVEAVISKPPAVKKRRIDEPSIAAKNEVEPEVTVNAKTSHIDLLDDSDDEEVDTKQPQAPAEEKRNNNDTSSSSGESDVSFVEVINVKQSKAETALCSGDWKCKSCKTVNREAKSTCIKCGTANDYIDFDYVSGVEDDTKTGLTAFGNSTQNTSIGYDISSTHQSMETPSSGESLSFLDSLTAWPLPIENQQKIHTSAIAMADNLERLAELFEFQQHDSVRPPEAPYDHFWDSDRYAAALRLLAAILRDSDSTHFVERIEDDPLIQAGKLPYSHVIKHPICFRDIVLALVENGDEVTSDSRRIPSGASGRLPVRGLTTWNMWKGLDLLQAIDLVFLNALAYGKAINEGKSEHRSATNKLRRMLWSTIDVLVTGPIKAGTVLRKEAVPTRRSETSGFVVYKIRG